MKWQVLVVEDEAIVQRYIEDALAEEAIELTFAARREKACNLLENNYYHAAIVDLYLPNMPAEGDEADGIHVIRAAKRLHPLISTMVLTSHDDKQNILRCLRAGASDWVDKGASTDYSEELRYRLKQALSRYESNNGLASLLQRYVFECGCPLYRNSGRCTETASIHEGYDPKNVFVIIPSSDYDDEKKAVKETLTRVGMRPQIEEDDRQVESPLCSICRKIRQSPYAIADITGRTLTIKKESVYVPRPSVLYELGLAHALARKVLILFRGTDGGVPYDLKGHKIAFYRQDKGRPRTADLVDELCNWLSTIPVADPQKVRECQEAAQREIAAWTKKQRE